MCPEAEPESLVSIKSTITLLRSAKPWTHGRAGLRQSLQAQRCRLVDLAKARALP